VRTAFVLGGGGRLGAHEVGMLRALLARGVRPDLVLGTSVGAINGAAIAAAPTAEGVERLAAMWSDLDRGDVFGGSVLGRLATLARTRTHLHANGPLRTLLSDALPVATFEELEVPFRCVAASIERAAERWFDTGPLVEAVLASSAVPGLLPPVRIGDEHYIDGGIVNSIPVRRAVDLGAERVYVLHAGRVEHPLSAPRWPWEVGLVAFEVTRRHRFHGDLQEMPDGVEVHVLPTGSPEPASVVRYGDTSAIGEHIARAEAATAARLVELGL
jgi:NTE family protein